MNRKSQAERILHSLTELHQQQQDIQTKLAQLLESILQTNDKPKGKQMIIVSALVFVHPILMGTVFHCLLKHLGN